MCPPALHKFLLLSAKIASSIQRAQNHIPMRGIALVGLIQMDEILKKEGPGFVRGMQTRGQGGLRTRLGRCELDFFFDETAVSSPKLDCSHYTRSCSLVQPTTGTARSSSIAFRTGLRFNEPLPNSPGSRLRFLAQRPGSSTCECLGPSRLQQGIAK
jgi:hypothetical protein